MSQLSHEPTKRTVSKPLDFAEHPTNIDHAERDSSSSFIATPSASSLVATPNKGGLSYNQPSEGFREVHAHTSKSEYEGESSLFSHAVFASRFLQNAIDNATNADVEHEMTVVLDSLRSVVHSSKQQSDTIDKLYPRARVIPPGSTTRNLQLPPIDKVFMCLRMAKECPQVETLWMGDYIKPSHFSDYLIKVASPGPATEADLIIVHYGLHRLFCECSKVVTDVATKQDYDAQAVMCETNLETVLANLRFHQPTNIDFAYAMGMAVSLSPSLSPQYTLVSSITCSVSSDCLSLLSVHLLPSEEQGIRRMALHKLSLACHPSPGSATQPKQQHRWI